MTHSKTYITLKLPLTCGRFVFSEQVLVYSLVFFAKFLETLCKVYNFVRNFTKTKVIKTGFLRVRKVEIFRDLQKTQYRLLLNCAILVLLPNLALPKIYKCRKKWVHSLLCAFFCRFLYLFSLMVCTLISRWAWKSRSASSFMLIFFFWPRSSITSFFWFWFAFSNSAILKMHY